MNTTTTVTKGEVMLLSQKVMTEYLKMQAAKESVVAAFTKLDNAIGWEDYSGEQIVSGIYAYINEDRYSYAPVVEGRNRWSEREEAKKTREAEDMVADSNG